ncbi:unnamed protein product [Amoebophrya sp. A25]|nr:unnamed protein product [Amoebophrya sp. A25]|eukprot:GSA25T00003381001.1
MISTKKIEQKKMSSSSRPSSDVEDRFLGLFLGLAAGDRNGGPVQMALELAEACLKLNEQHVGDTGAGHPEHNSERIMQGYLRWWHQGPDSWDTGRIAATIFQRVEESNAGSRHETAPSVQHTTPHAASSSSSHTSQASSPSGSTSCRLENIASAVNAEMFTATVGALHRCGFLAAVFSHLSDEELASLGRKESRLTHCHPISQHCCGAYVVLLRKLLLDGGIGTIESAHAAGGVLEDAAPEDKEPERKRAAKKGKGCGGQSESMTEHVDSGHHIHTGDHHVKPKACSAEVDTTQKNTSTNTTIARTSSADDAFLHTIEEFAQKLHSESDVLPCERDQVVNAFELDVTGCIIMDARASKVGAAHITKKLNRGGLCVDALRSALHFVALGSTFDHALQESITFAGPDNYCPVLVGAIAGARWGACKISEKHLEHCREGVRERCRDLARRCFAIYAQAQRKIHD